MATKALFGLLASGLLVAWFYGPWQAYCIDYFRQYMFVRRDRLFDHILSNGKDFSSEDYRTIRMQLESSIRFAHKITFLRIFTLWLFCKALRGSRGVPADNVVASIKDVSTRREFGLALDEVRNQMILTMVMRSGLLIFVGITVLPVLVVALVAFALARRARMSIANKVELALRKQYAEGARRITEKVEIEALCA